MLVALHRLVLQDAQSVPQGAPRNRLMAGREGSWESEAMVRLAWSICCWSCCWHGPPRRPLQRLILATTHRPADPPPGTPAPRPASVAAPRRLDPAGPSRPARPVRPPTPPLQPEGRVRQISPI